MQCQFLIFILLIPSTLCRSINENSILSFFYSFTSIIITELGDKTFFLAAIMSIKYNKIAVLIGSMIALLIISSISTIFGIVIPELIDLIYVHIIVNAILFMMGVKFIYTWYTLQKEKEEFQEVEQELTTLDKKLMNLPDPESDQVNDNVTRNFIQVQFQSVVWQAFTLTFLGEWGDKSQITTINLAAIHDPKDILFGALIAHLICTIIAVQGGRLIANKISEKNFNLFGGIVFILISILNSYEFFVIQ